MEKIVEKYRNECVSSIDIEEMLKNLENKNEHLEKKTLFSIQQDILNTLMQNGCEKKNAEKICNGLIGYRVIQEIYELHKGKCVKIMRIGRHPLTLKTFGIVVDVKFMEKGTYVTCMFLNPIKYMTYRYDNYITFQKMSEEELYILQLRENIG